MTTPHISASPGDFAPAVLMPGDPLRARHIAETFLDDAKLVTSVRNMEGYTGTYKDTPVSAMGSGMGIPSISIYATELFRFFAVETIIRVGSCGSIDPSLAIGDVILASGASTDSGVNRRRIQGHDLAAVADFGLLRAAVETAERLEQQHRVGPIFSSDLFYGPDDGLFKTLGELGILGVEMEAAALYGIAQAEGGRALTIATVSDALATGAQMTPKQRQTAVNDMIVLALETVVAL